MDLKRLWDRWFRKASVAEVKIRQAIDADVQFIFELSLLHAHRGHFNDSFTFASVKAGLTHQISCAVRDAPVPMPGERNNAGARVFVVTVDGERAAFTMFLEDRPGSWHDRVELFMVAVADKYIGCGIGTLMLNQLLPGVPAKVIYARCFAPSTTMKTMLERVGFATTEVSAAGTSTLERRRN